MIILTIDDYSNANLYGRINTSKIDDSIENPLTYRVVAAHASVYISKCTICNYGELEGRDSKQRFADTRSSLLKEH